MVSLICSFTKKRPLKQRPTRKAPHWKRSTRAYRRRIKRFRATENGTCDIVGGTITWVLPRKLASLNRLRTWRARHGDTQAWEKEFERTRVSANDLSLGPCTSRRLRLEVIRLAPTDKYYLDMTNLAGGVKGLEDALVRLQFLVDDSVRWLDGPHCSQGVSKDGKYWTIVRLLSPHDETPTT